MLAGKHEAALLKTGVIGAMEAAKTAVEGVAAGIVAVSGGVLQPRIHGERMEAV